MENIKLYRDGEAEYGSGHTPPPPTPLELEQLEEMVNAEIKKFTNVTYTERTAENIKLETSINGIRTTSAYFVWNLIKPLISSMLQAKDERIKELEMRLSHKEKSISRWMSESDYCITQLQEKESEIAQLKKESDTANIVEVEKKVRVGVLRKQIGGIIGHSEPQIGDPVYRLRDRYILEMTSVGRIVDIPYYLDTLEPYIQFD